MRIDMNESSKLSANKEVVRRFNKEVIERLDQRAFQELMHKDFINHTAALVGISPGADGIWHTFQNILKPAFPDLSVEIHEQIAEGDKVTTRKTIRGTHLGPFMGIPATKQTVTIEVIDIVTVRDGKYLEHWGINTLFAVAAKLRER
jgi:predicted ester cyclase